MAKRHGTRTQDLESVFLRLEELVLANSGEDSFEEIFKLVVAKLWDESRHPTAPLFVPHSDSAQTRAAIHQLLREAAMTWPDILGDQIESGLANEHLGVCVANLADHTLFDASFEVMDSAFEFLVSRNAKGAKGQFFTPRHVIEFCTRVINPLPRETICDPACGSGGFLIHALRHAHRGDGGTARGTSELCESSVWGFDIDPRAVRVAKTLMLLAGAERANLFRLNSLLRSHLTVDLFETASSDDAIPLLTIEDVVRKGSRPFKGFDVLMTNPPFAGEIKERRLLQTYSLARAGRRVERDVLFLERCVELLRPGGRIAIVLPHNKLASPMWSYVREWLLRQVRVIAVIGLGRNTFLPHTHQKAELLIATKRSKPIRGFGVEPILFAISEKDGKNSKGQVVLRHDAVEKRAIWERVDHDLEQVTTGFWQFLREQRDLTEGNAWPIPQSEM